MTDEEFNSYLEKYQKNFNGNKDHLKILLETGLIDLDMDLSNYPMGPKGKNAAFLSPSVALEEYPWNKWRSENKNIEPDLQGINLDRENGANLMFANFENVNLEKASFQGTCMQNMNLKNAKLFFAKFNNANLRKSNLEGAFIKAADLTGAELGMANLQNANLSYSNLFGANLRWANLEGTDLKDANLENTHVGYVKYNRKTKCHNIRVATCEGSAQFKRFAQDQDYIEDFSNSHKIVFWLWKISCNCGRTFSLWATWSLFFAMSFGLIYYNLGEKAFHLQNLKWSFETMIYYSVVTFTTYGFGDIFPKSTLAVRLVMIEVILGYIMLGGLISIFATKIARRS